MANRSQLSASIRSRPFHVTVPKDFHTRYNPAIAVSDPAPFQKTAEVLNSAPWATRPTGPTCPKEAAVAPQTARAYTEAIPQAAGGHAVSITLTPEQQDTLDRAIQSGRIGSVEEFIGSSIGALSRREGEFDPEKARIAVARMRELRKGIALDLQGESIRQMAHAGHKY